jgi:hypothetical protein
MHHHISIPFASSIQSNHTTTQTMNRLRIIRAVARTQLTRTFTSSSTRSASWQSGPAPPKLPKEEQELFEKLQRESQGAFSTPPSQQETPTSTPSLADLRARINQSPQEGQVDAKISADGKGEELHPDIRRGAQPEFKGDRNPKTGEVGGPKNEPLRWGESGDWSYNGRVTDF